MNTWIETSREGLLRQFISSSVYVVRAIFPGDDGGEISLSLPSPLPFPAQLAG